MMHAKGLRSNGANRCLQIFAKTSLSRIHSILLQIDRSQMTAVYCNKRRGRVNVKRTSPDTAIHEQNGYAKVYNDKYTFKTNVDNCDTTYMTYTNKHKHNMREVLSTPAPLLDVLSSSHMCHTHIGSSLLSLSLSSTYHP